MPNAFSYFALFAWPVVTFFLYRSLPRAQALIATILGGYLLLPFGVGINLPVLPTFDKTLIPAFSALVMSFLVASPSKRMARQASLPAQPADRDGDMDAQEGTPFTRSPGASRTRTLGRKKDNSAKKNNFVWIGTALLLLLFLTPFVTVATNGETTPAGPRVLPGLQLYDAFSMGLTSLVMVLPFLLARRDLATPENHTLLLRSLVLWGLFYSLPTLFEVRMSPQLSRWIYGFLAQSFAQTIRDGSFRPVVFLQHGLWLAIFMATTILAAALLWRATREKAGASKRGSSGGTLSNPGRWLLALVWLLGTLVLSHSLGALLIALLLLPVVLFMSIRSQLILASVVAVIILTYPALRTADLIPVNQAISLAESFSPARAQSLEFRVDNENQLLGKARAKPLAGWGGWGRSFLHDPNTGADITVTDGYWIIVIGMSGWLGYIAQFGLLTAPIFLLTWRRKVLGVDIVTTGLVVLLVANLVDMILNATLTPVTWLIAGALMGRLAIPTKDAEAEPTPMRIRERRQKPQNAREPVAAMRIS